MGISAFIAEAVAELSARGELASAQTLLEFGPQSLATLTGDTGYYTKLARRIGGDAAAQAFQAAAFDGQGRFRHDAQKAFYSIFGIDQYDSVDLLDPQATYCHNLNDPLVLDRQYDIVTDFGTAEHVFNIGQNFVNAHNALKVGGLWLAQWPTLGGYYHGFYSVHTVWFRSLAAFSGYEMTSLWYCTDNTVTAKACEIQGGLVKVEDIRRREPRRMMASFFVADVMAALRRKERASAVIFCAMRKTKDGPLVWPQQINKYARAD